MQLQGAISSQEKESHKSCLEMCATDKCKATCGGAASAQQKVIASDHVYFLVIEYCIPVPE